MEPNKEDSNKVKRLFVIDAMAMAFRNFHAFSRQPLTTAQGLPTSALFGSANFILSLINEEKPDYLVVAMDSREPTFRHERYPAYKANRTEMPEDLVKQLPYFLKLFDAFGLKTLKVSGQEADDLIGSLVTKFASPEVACYIVSGDKDFMQLISDHVFLYSPKKGEPAKIVDRSGVLERFSCKPEQVVDVLALMGDSADNIPGVPGIGEKGAVNLIKDFGSLERIYDMIALIKNPKQKEHLTKAKDEAFLARELVTINCTVNIDYHLQDFAYISGSQSGDQKEWHPKQELLDLFNELEFRSLANKLKGVSVSSVPKHSLPSPEASKTPETPSQAIQSIETYEKTSELSYVVVSDKTTLDEWTSVIEKAQEFCFDTETTGLNVIEDKPVGISFSTAEKKGFYIPLAEQKGISSYMMASEVRETVLQRLRVFLGDPRKLKIGHNVKFDIQMLHNLGVGVRGPFVDTMILSYVLDPVSRDHSLDSSTLKHLNYQKISLSSMLDLSGQDGARSITGVPLEKLARYAIEDADLTYRLFLRLWPEVEKAGLTRLCGEIEMPLIPVLAEMEQAGVFVDTDFLSEYSVKLDAMAKEREAKIYEIAGEHFNINSPKQLQVILYEKLKIPETLGVTRIKKTKTGFSTDVSVLEKLSDHPLPAAILEYRSVMKLKSVYVEALPQLVNAKTKRVHTSYHQTGTATGRLSSSDPNLQNIPIRSDLGREIRKAFCAEKGSVIISADYSQIELRILSHLAEDAALIEAFKRGQDIHRTTAAKIFGVPPDQVSDTLRSRAKAINFGIIYGMGPQRLARETGVSMSEAKEFIEKYFAGFPGVRTFIDTAIKKARENGFSTTMVGRRRPIPELQSKNRQEMASAENVAVNSPVQGSAADLIKKAMIMISHEFEKQNLRSKMIMQVHDELVFEGPKNEADQVMKTIKLCMETAMDLTVPLVVDVGCGDNWLEAH